MNEYPRLGLAIALMIMISGLCLMTWIAAQGITTNCWNQYQTEQQAIENCEQRP